MAYVPDEAVKSGSEVSLAAKAVYQVICAYRNRASGICSLKNKTRIAEEAGVSRTGFFRTARELIDKKWIAIDDLDNIRPMKGVFTDATVGEASKRLTSKKSKNVLKKSVASGDTVSHLSIGTEVALKGNILITNNKETIAAVQATPSSDSDNKKLKPQKTKTQPTGSHSVLMKFLFDKYGAIPDASAQGKAIKWLLSVPYAVPDCVACFESLCLEPWRSTRISWQTVQKEIGNWKTKQRTKPTGPPDGKYARPMTDIADYENTIDVRTSGFKA